HPDRYHHGGTQRQRLGSAAAIHDHQPMDRQRGGRFPRELSEQLVYGNGRSRRLVAPEWVSGELHRRQSAVRLGPTSWERRQLDLSFPADLGEKTLVSRTRRGAQLYLVDS